MCFVVIVDVYGNYFVLEVVFVDICVYGIIDIVDFGDMVSGLFDVCRIIEMLMWIDVVYVFGNYDCYLFDWLLEKMGLWDCLVFEVFDVV